MHSLIDRQVSVEVLNHLQDQLDCIQIQNKFRTV